MWFLFVGKRVWCGRGSRRMFQHFVHFCSWGGGWAHVLTCKVKWILSKSHFQLVILPISKRRFGESIFISCARPVLSLHCELDVGMVKRTIETELCLLSALSGCDFLDFAREHDQVVVVSAVEVHVVPEVVQLLEDNVVRLEVEQLGLLDVLLIPRFLQL